MSNAFKRLSDALADVEYLFLTHGVSGDALSTGVNNSVWSYAGAYLTKHLRLAWDALFWKDEEGRENGLLDVHLYMRHIFVAPDKTSVEKSLSLVSMQYLMGSTQWAVSFGSPRITTARWFRDHFEERLASPEEAARILEAVASFVLLDLKTT